MITENKYNNCEKRLLAIADAVRNSKEDFDMTRWRKVGDCGTTYCAIGLGVHLGILKSVKFRGNCLVPSDTPDDVTDVVGLETKFVSAAALELGLTVGDFYTLFVPKVSLYNKSRNRELWAKRIEAFVEMNVCRREFERVVLDYDGKDGS